MRNYSLGSLTLSKGHPGSEIGEEAVPAALWLLAKRTVFLRLRFSHVEHRWGNKTKWLSCLGYPRKSLQIKGAVLPEASSTPRGHTLQSLLPWHRGRNVNRSMCFIFKSLSVCGNQELSRGEVWPRDKITNSFHLPFRVLITINLPSFNHKTICLLDHVEERGLFWYLFADSSRAADITLDKLNLSGGFPAPVRGKVFQTHVN